MIAFTASAVIPLLRDFSAPLEASVVETALGLAPGDGEDVDVSAQAASSAIIAVEIKTVGRRLMTYACFSMINTVADKVPSIQILAEI
jgi:hypothetical protein